MNERISHILEEISRGVSRLDGVFSTPQWGGRAYKLPGRGGNRKKPKLVAFVSVNDNDDAITVSFKLMPSRAEEVIEKYGWIEPHGFRTLAPSGWVTACVSTKRQLKPLLRLIEESRAQYPVQEEPTAVIEVKRGVGSQIARHIDGVMKDIGADGWKPRINDDLES